MTFVIEAEVQAPFVALGEDTNFTQVMETMEALTRPNSATFLSDALETLYDNLIAPLTDGVVYEPYWRDPYKRDPWNRVTQGLCCTECLTLPAKIAKRVPFEH